MIPLSLQEIFQRQQKALARHYRVHRYISQQNARERDVRNLRRAQERAWRRERARRHTRDRAGEKAAAPLRPTKIEVSRWGVITLAVIAVFSLAGNAVQYFHYSPARTLVKVGDRAVPQQEYLADLDATAGRAVLDRIVYGELVRQAALRAGVFPTPAQVDARLAAQPGGSAQNAPPRDAVALQIALENLRLVGTTATEAEIAAFYAAHKAQLAPPPRVMASLIVTTRAADAARAAVLLAAGRTDAEIAALPRTRAAGVGGFEVHVQALPPALRGRLRQMMFAAPLGTVRTLACPDGTFLTAEAHSRSGGTVPPLAQVHDQVARLVRLQKAPSEQAELASLSRATPPTFEMSRYARYFSDAESANATGTGAAPRTAALPAAEAH